MSGRHRAEQAGARDISEERRTQNETSHMDSVLKPIKKSILQLFYISPVIIIEFVQTSKRFALSALCTMVISYWHCFGLIVLDYLAMGGPAVR